MKSHSPHSSPESANAESGRQKWNDWFRQFAHKTSETVGCPWTFFAALALIFVWAVMGPAFDFSDTWQLVINTGTTIVTFLMVFLIQNTQNRDARAIHLKLDELIHCIKGARNSLVALETLSDEELARLEKQFERIHRAANGKHKSSAGKSEQERTSSAARR